MQFRVYTVNMAWRTIHFKIDEVWHYRVDASYIVIRNPYTHKRYNVSPTEFGFSDYDTRAPLMPSEIKRYIWRKLRFMHRLPEQGDRQTFKVAALDFLAPEACETIAVADCPTNGPLTGYRRERWGAPLPTSRRPSAAHP